MTSLIGRSGGQRAAAGEAALRVLEHKCGPSSDTGRRGTGTVLGALMVGRAGQFSRHAMTHTPWFKPTFSFCNQQVLSDVPTAFTVDGRLHCMGVTLRFDGSMPSTSQAP